MILVLTIYQRAASAADKASDVSDLYDNLNLLKKTYCYCPDRPLSKIVLDWIIYLSETTNFDLDAVWFFP